MAVSKVEGLPKDRAAVKKLQLSYQTGCAYIYIYTHTVIHMILPNIVT